MLPLLTVNIQCLSSDFLNDQTLTTVPRYWLLSCDEFSHWLLIYFDKEESEAKIEKKKSRENNQQTSQ